MKSICSLQELLTAMRIVCQFIFVNLLFTEYFTFALKLAPVCA